MKNSKLLYIFFMSCIIPVIFCSCSTTKTNSKSSTHESTYKSMVDSQNFVFAAQSVTPLRGNFHNLTSPYDVTVTKDSLISYLPYFGRAYNAQYNVTEPALDFTSTNFSYVVSSHKKNAWHIVIKPKDKTDIQQYFFTIYDNGAASLSVTSTSRDAISFSGHIESRK